MVSQEELEYAIARYKAREAGEDFAEAVPSGQLRGLALVEGEEELSADAYQMEDGAEELDAYAQAYDTEDLPAEGGGGVPHHVHSLSDSSLIEMGEEGYDPERDR